MGSGARDRGGPGAADRGAAPPLHRQHLQRAAALQISRDDAMAAGRFLSLQRRLCGAGAIADPPLSASRPGATRSPLPSPLCDDAGPDPGGRELLALEPERMARIYYAGQSARPVALGARRGVSRGARGHASAAVPAKGRATDRARRSCCRCSIAAAQPGRRGAYPEKIPREITERLAVELQEPMGASW